MNKNIICKFGIYGVLAVISVGMLSSCDSSNPSTSEIDIEDDIATSSSEDDETASSSSNSSSSTKSSSSKQSSSSQIASSSSTKATSSSSVKVSSSSSTPIEDLSSSSWIVSSSSKTSSSSIEVLSSSSWIVSGAKYKYDPAKITHGVFRDPRDEQEYKTITIDNQTWMAENLRYEVSINTADTIDFYCPTRADSLAYIGCHYTWKAANEACPDGWKLPTTNDYIELIDKLSWTAPWGILETVCKTSPQFDNRYKGDNIYGFNITNAGYLYTKTTRVNTHYAYLWTETYKQFLGNIAPRIAEFSFKDDLFTEDQAGSSLFANVRCIKGKRGEKSSSSTSKSSSSSQAYSSSAPGETIYDPIKQTLTDGRDGKVYKTTTIDGRVWMAENLNFEYTYKTARSFCYKSDTANCTKYGRLYTWSAVMDSAGTYSSDGLGCGLAQGCTPAKTVQGICPEGWHVSTDAEWRDLFYFIGGYHTKKLRANHDWSGYEGTDDFGFSVLASGKGESSGRYEFEGQDAVFWTASPLKNNMIHISRGEDYFIGTLAPDRKYQPYYYLRCVMNYDNEKEIPKPDHEIIYGTIEDSRDGNVYKTVQIGDRTWMAENMKLEYHEGSAESQCPQDNPEYCKSFGRLYTWTAAMDSAAIYTDDGKGCGNKVSCDTSKFITGICPNGWRLPKKGDATTLMYAVGGEGIAGRNLKSIQGWPEEDVSYDRYGFNATPISETDSVYYWTSTYQGNYFDYAFGFEHVSMLFLSTSSNTNTVLFPVRCIKMTQEEINIK